MELIEWLCFAIGQSHVCDRFPRPLRKTLVFLLSLFLTPLTDVFCSLTVQPPFRLCFSPSNSPVSVDYYIKIPIWRFPSSCASYQPHTMTMSTWWWKFHFWTNIYSQYEMNQVSFLHINSSIEHSDKLSDSNSTWLWGIPKGNLCSFSCISFFEMHIAAQTT